MQCDLQVALRRFFSAPPKSIHHPPQIANRKLPPARQISTRWFISAVFLGRFRFKEIFTAPCMNSRAGRDVSTSIIHHKVACSSFDKTGNFAPQNIMNSVRKVARSNCIRRNNRAFYKFNSESRSGALLLRNTHPTRLRSPHTEHVVVTLLGRSCFECERRATCTPTTTSIDGICILLWSLFFQFLHTWWIGLGAPFVMNEQHPFCLVGFWSLLNLRFVGSLPSVFNFDRSAKLSSIFRPFPTLLWGFSPRVIE